MANSSTDIANEALAHLGEKSISSIDDNSAAARACKQFYESCRDKLLRSHRWNFAVKRAALSQLEDAPEFGWDYQYQLPADHLRSLEINNTEVNDLITDEWSIEGGLILTNAATVNLVYIRREENVALFDDLFCEALALKMAIAISEAVRGTTPKTRELIDFYEMKVAPLARRVDANEGRRRKGLLSMSSMALRMRSNYGSSGLYTGEGSSSAPAASAEVANDSITLAKLAGGSAGALLGFDSNGDPAEVVAGTSGYVLTSTGLTTPPAWSDLATAAAITSKLPLAGGTMTGAISMGSNKVTDVTDGSAAGDAVNKGQLDAIPTAKAIGYALVRDEKSNGTGGGTSSAGTWNVRDLNTEVYDTLGRVSVASNQITFAAGTYLIKARAPCYRATRTRLKLVDTAGPTELARGQGGYIRNSDNAGVALLTARLNFASSTTVELHHYTQSGIATSGLGVAVSDGGTEVFAEVEIIVED